jgi:putative DNA primase/helicase
LAATTEQWDADLWLLNTPDGVVDLHTGRLREHQATDYMTKQTAVAPKGGCPRWRAFLQETPAAMTRCRAICSVSAAISSPA